MNLGDSLSGPLHPLETAQFLMATDWLHVSGNHERQLLTLPGASMGLSDAYAASQLSRRELDWLGSLPAAARLGDDVFLCHGTPVDDTEYFLETVDPSGVRMAHPAEVSHRLGTIESRLVLCGHSHVPRALRAPSGQLIVNPGSVGLQAYDDDRPYPHVIETGSPDARYAIVERRDNEWSAALMSVPYGFESMVSLARQRHRPDWAAALASGRSGIL